MSLEFVLLGLIHMHPDATGYDLNRIINDRTQNFLSAALSHIYPSLKKLHKNGFVSYKTEPIKNRPSKKMYQITEAGEQELQSWLKEPIESRLDMNPFFLKMSFSPLMDKATIIQHIDREIDFREKLDQLDETKFSIELAFLNQDMIDLEKTRFLWQEIANIHHNTENLRLNWLKDWRNAVEKNLKA